MRYSELTVKNLLKTFSSALSAGRIFIIFGSMSYFVFLPIFNIKTSTGKFREFLGFKANPSENSKILDEQSVYGCLAQFLIVSKKICSFSQLTHRDEEFLHRLIHTYPFYRNLMIFIMKMHNFNGDKYGLSKGLLDLYGSGQERNNWQRFSEAYQELVRTLSNDFVPKEGCDQERVKELLRNV